MNARLYALAWRVLPYASLGPLGALVLVQLFGAAK